MEDSLKEVIHKLRYIFILLSTVLVQMGFSLTAQLTIDNIQVTGNHFLWEIHFRPVSGWTGGPGDVNSFLQSASWYFKYNSSALNAPVLVYQNPMVQGHYHNTIGIAGGRVYVSTADMSDPQQVTQGTKYHLYTVSMTILNSSAVPGLEWDVINTAIENLYGAIATGPDLDTSTAWTIELTYTFAQTGWYMVSLPVIPQDSTVSTLFPDALGSHAFIWNPVMGTYETVTKIQPGKGYWIAIPGAVSYTVTGRAFHDYTEHFLMPGWYMIGSVLGGADWTNPNDIPDESVWSPAFGWDAKAGMYTQTTRLNEKEGYWTAVFGACDLTVGGMERELAKSISGVSSMAFYQKYGNEPPGPPNIDWKTGNLIVLPKEYVLSQNFPNPFNDNTMIEIGLPEEGHVEVIIMDVLGREVCRLVDRILNPGYHKIMWNGVGNDGRKVSSGIYFYTLRVKQFSETRKFLVIR
jgi:hypothetical protein